MIKNLDKKIENFDKQIKRILEEFPILQSEINDKSETIKYLKLIEQALKDAYNHAGKVVENRDYKEVIGEIKVEKAYKFEGLGGRR